MAQHNDFGNEGETIARQFLQKKGYLILESNWKSGHREIDIIAKDGGTLVIVEVKTRMQGSLTAPEESVNASKIRNLVRAAESYVRTHELDTDVRFDVIGITPVADGYEINHIADAFYPPLNMR
ncbi:MAG: YraN family protein [Candidatus Aphodosoma sp.]